MSKQIDVICLSHLRWDYGFQRPYQLMSRCARGRRVFFFEEPIFDAERPHLSITEAEDRLYVAVPHLPAAARDAGAPERQRELLDELVSSFDVEKPLLWFCMPTALEFARHVQAGLVVYDCTEELSAAMDAIPRQRELEDELLRRAQLVFTDSHSLYEAVRARHKSVHACPSGVDLAHFSRGRAPLPDPTDQAPIRFPRLGFLGVIDERVDLALLGRIASQRPDWQLVMVGPVAGTSPALLPESSNIHYLGPKAYDELPSYLASWQVALAPLALGEPARAGLTMTLEYLAAGRPVVSTPIPDVVRSYAEAGLVRIAARDGFEAAIEDALSESIGRRRARADAFLDGMSWDATWSKMATLIESILHAPSSKVA